jgi:hypothetical protein
MIGMSIDPNAAPSIGSPNDDTTYSWALLDLRREPFPNA